MLSLIHSVYRIGYTSTYLLLELTVQYLSVNSCLNGCFQTAVLRDKYPLPHCHLQTAISLSTSLGYRTDVGNSLYCVCLSHTYSVNSHLTAAYRQLFHGIYRDQNFQTLV